MSERDRVDEIQSEWARERPDLDVTPLALIARLHRLANRLTDELLVIYRAHGLGEGEFDILATLRRSGGRLSAGDIANHTMVTTGAVSKRLDRLERAGLVERQPDPRDARGRQISLTTQGRALIDEAFTAHMANEARLIEGLTTAQRSQLEGLLKAWAAQLELSSPAD